MSGDLLGGLIGYSKHLKLEVIGFAEGQYASAWPLLAGVPLAFDIDSIENPPIRRLNPL